MTIHDVFRQTPYEPVFTEVAMKDADGSFIKAVADEVDELERAKERIRQGRMVREGRAVLALVDEKPTNPKDIIGSDKLPLGQVPASAIAYAALGHLEGTLKYGLVNWREVGVRWSIYYDACLRHMAKVHNGEWEDAATGVPHLGNALACINIIVDAYESGKLVDDRPKPAPVAGLIDRFTEKVKRLKGLFAHHQPQHYTQAYEVERAKEVAVPPAR